MKLDFGDNQNFVKPLCNLYQASKRWYKDSTLIIDRFKFSKGYAIFSFELDPSDLGGGSI